MRIIAVVLSLMMVLPLAASTALTADAHIGPVDENTVVQTSTGTYQSNDGRSYVILQNTYISFFICIDSPVKSERGTLCYTVPTSTLNAVGTKNLTTFPAQHINTYKVSDIKVNTWGDTTWEKTLSTPACMMPSCCWYDVSENDDQVIVSCSFDDSDYLLENTFTLERVGHGLLNAGDESDEVQAKYAEEENWAVRCSSLFSSNSKNIIIY